MMGSTHSNHGRRRHRGRHFWSYSPVVLLLLLWTSSLVAGQCEEAPDGFFGDESQCDRYYHCKDGVLMEDGLCPDGLVYNIDGPPDRSNCELPFSVNCTGREVTQEPKGNEDCPRAFGFFPHSTSCGKFWQCAEGVGYLKDCPEGLAYNQFRGICDWPDNVESCPSEKLASEAECPEADEEEIRKYGFPRYAHPADCRKLYVCIPGGSLEGRRVPRLLGCEFGMVFNDELKVCDWPENVPGCENYYDDVREERLREARERRAREEERSRAEEERLAAEDERRLNDARRIRRRNGGTPRSADGIDEDRDLEITRRRTPLTAPIASDRNEPLADEEEEVRTTEDLNETRDDDLNRNNNGDDDGTEEDPQGGSFASRSPAAAPAPAPQPARRSRPRAAAAAAAANPRPRPVARRQPPPVYDDDYEDTSSSSGVVLDEDYEGSSRS